jgi:hypothetical protein
MALNTSAIMDEPKTLDEALKRLIGEQLSSVEFVQDYLQLRFDGPFLTVYGFVHHVIRNQCSVSWGQPGYRDTLGSLISHQIKQTELSGEKIFLTFDNESIWSMSLREQDRNGPEALMYVDGSDKIWVV